MVAILNHLAQFALAIQSCSHMPGVQNPAAQKKYWQPFRLNSRFICKKRIHEKRT